ncbi:hypothetical protein NL676_027937 [Syzygium grande]|nr:hypothetical protein NL676_027937 [Syzygium grande]
MYKIDDCSPMAALSPCMPKRWSDATADRTAKSKHNGLLQLQARERASSHVDGQQGKPPRRNLTFPPQCNARVFAKAALIPGNPSFPSA